MIKNFKTVTVVGGGSAGWMSASMLIKTFPDCNIQIIESPDYPIVGVGESTLLGIREFLNYLDLSEDDEKNMMRSTDASYKMSIKFTDFYEKDSGGYHYPFQKSIAYTETGGYGDWLYRKALDNSIPVQDFVNTYTPSSYLFENNKFSDNENGEFPNWYPKKDCSYHFDAVKLGQWLKTNYCIPRGVEVIPDTVVDIHQNGDGIGYLVLKSGRIVKSDLYIDCTGFKSLLLSQTLNSPFTSFEDKLPNNRAWAVHLPYKDKEKELEGFTNSTAIGHGWCWNIPLWSRIGTGYVYSDKFISPEDAKEEFKQYLMSDKVAIPRSREEVESLEYRDIQMRVGMHQKSFVKNVVAIGLSAGFIEPLESNGLLSVHVFLFKLMKTLLRRNVTQYDRDAYNTETYNFFSRFANFICLHYALSIRNDTEYWKAVTEKTFDETMYSPEVYHDNSFLNISYRKYNDGILQTDDGISFISVGMNYMVYDIINVSTARFWIGERSKLESEEIFSQMDIAKTVWEDYARQAPTLYKYLKENIHS